MHGQQPQLAIRARKQPQLHAAAHVVVQRKRLQIRSAGEGQTATNGEAIVLYRDAAREAELVIREQQPRGVRAVDLLQCHHIRAEFTRVAAHRRDVFAAARHVVGDVAGNRTAGTVPGRIGRRAGRRERAQRFRFHEPFEVPGGELELGESRLGAGRSERKSQGKKNGAHEHARHYLTDELLPALLG